MKLVFVPRSCHKLSHGTKKCHKKYSLSHVTSCLKIVTKKTCLFEVQILDVKHETQKQKIGSRSRNSKFCFPFLMNPQKPAETESLFSKSLSCPMLNTNSFRFEFEFGRESFCLRLILSKTGP